MVSARKVPQAYWRMRNRDAESGADFSRLDPAASACHRERFESDAELMALHESVAPRTEAGSRPG
ncbi:MAG: hypothetical protein ACK4NE_03305 [Albidovulum sp.]